MKRIADTRREISLLAEASSKSTHTSKVQRKIFYVGQKYQIENDTSRLMVVEKLKEKIQAWAQRIRRYKRRIDFRVQNRLFETVAKKFYRNLTQKPNGNAVTPSKYDIEAFWAAIWEESIFYNKDASWLQSEVDAANELAETVEDVHEFSEEDLFQAIKNMGN